MAWGVFVFSKDGRARLAGVLRALLIGQLVVSLCMVIFCYNLSMKVMLLLKNIHKVKVVLLYGLILLQAYAMKLHYTSGLRLIALMLKCPHWSRMSLFCRNWMFSGSVLPANGILVYVACRATLKALAAELSVSLCYGISQYLTEPFWKQLMDTMQIELSCCGAEMPSDWHEIPWINMDFLNEDSELVLKLAGTDGKVLPPVSPYSCCTPHVLAACYHDPLQQAECRSLWLGGSPLPSASLHARGCVEAVRTPLTRALLGMHCFTMLVVIFEVLILVLFRLLRTSARDAALRGQPAGEGRGALLGQPAGEGRGALLGQPAGEGRGALLGALAVPRALPDTKPAEKSVQGGECLEPSAFAVSLQRRKRRRKVIKHNSYPFLS